jgi:4-amino-4-deoxy-L-arabinose transferase-like glycosyltransferase
MSMANPIQSRNAIMKWSNLGVLLSQTKSAWAHRLLLLTVIALALSVRVLYAIFFPAPTQSALNADGWGTIAHNLIDGYGYTYPYHLDPNPQAGPLQPNVGRGPVPVLLYASLFWLFGYSVLPVVLANWFLDVMSIVIIYRLGREIFKSPLVGLLAGMIYALYIPEVTVAQYAYSEPIFTFLLLGFTLCFLWLLSRPTIALASLTGLLLGLATLSRTSAMLLPLVCLPFLFIFLRDWRAVVKYFGILCLVFVLVLVPWTVRNYFTFHTFYPGTTLFGSNVFTNNYYLETEDYSRELGWNQFTDVTRQIYEERGEVMTDESPIEVDRLLLTEGLKRIGARPDRYLIVTCLRFFRMWFSVGFSTPPSLRSYMVMVANALLLVLTLVAFLFFRAEWTRQAWPIVAIIAYHTLLYSLVNAQVRYSFPFIPYIVLFVAYASYRIISHSKARLDLYRIVQL